jgi:hypothetical protein
VDAEALFDSHKLNKSKSVSPPKLAKLSTSLLYFLLPEKNAGAKECQHGDTRRVYELFLQYYQTSGYICSRLLEIILRDLENEFGVTKHVC